MLTPKERLQMVGLGMGLTVVVLAFYAAAAFIITTAARCALQ